MVIVTLYGILLKDLIIRAGKSKLWLGLLIPFVVIIPLLILLTLPIGVFVYGILVIPMVYIVYTRPYQLLTLSGCPQK